MAVDQLEPPVRQLVGEEAAGKANLLIQGQEGGLLLLRVEPEIEFVRHQVPGTDTAMGFDAVADGIHGEGCFGKGCEYRVLRTEYPVPSIGTGEPENPRLGPCDCFPTRYRVLGTARTSSTGPGIRE